MIRYANLKEAKRIVPQWGGDPSSIEHLGDRGNSVFCFKNQLDNLQILRFTDPEFRSFEELVGELNFVNHLHASGVLVAESIPTTDNKYAFFTECESGNLICSSVSYAPGIEVQESSPHWSNDFFKEWGRNLALIHQAATTFKPANARARWQWDKEILIARAEQLIPKDDKQSLEEFEEIVSRCRTLPKPPHEFGLIHADHAPQNFRYDVDRERITSFDFGNCCYHWFISDLAISLSTVRRKPNREQIRSAILEGYSSIRPLPPNLDELIDLFIRLRVVYVYLSRLHLWSENRTRQEARDLEIFKERVHAKTGWGNAELKAKGGI